MLKLLDFWDTNLGKLLIGSKSIPRQRSMLESKKMEGVEDLRSTLTSDLEIQSGVCTIRFQYFFGTIFPHYANFIPFWNGNMYLVPLFDEIM